MRRPKEGNQTMRKVNICAYGCLRKQNEGQNERSIQGKMRRKNSSNNCWDCAIILGLFVRHFQYGSTELTHQKRT